MALELVFQSYDQIVALCCEAWTRLIDQPWTILSIGHREWVSEFWSMQVGISAAPGKRKLHRAEIV
jgi:hypothetical protein